MGTGSGAAPWQRAWLLDRKSSTELPSIAGVPPQEEGEHPHKALQENTDVLTIAQEAAAELSAEVCREHWLAMGELQSTGTCCLLGAP